MNHIGVSAHIDKIRRVQPGALSSGVTAENHFDS
jgi:hypothetical protein